jgi:hypothetical protein
MEALDTIRSLFPMEPIVALLKWNWLRKTNIVTEEKPLNN